VVLSRYHHRSHVLSKKVGIKLNKEITLPRPALSIAQDEERLGFFNLKDIAQGEVASTRQGGKRMRGKGGMTLLEVMIVVTIVGILAAIAIPAYNDYITRSRRSDAFTALETVRAAQEMYRAEKGEYRNTADFNVGLLPGCSQNMAGDNYNLVLTATDSDGDGHFDHYTIDAQPQDKQVGDYWFRIDQDGVQWYYDVKAPSPTWKNDKKFEDLR
jgi:prepilin-type N-terminal cleavage/methylation domain-containing protein